MARKKKELTLIEKLERVKWASCDSECEGRCSLCPADVIQEALDKLRFLEEEGEQK